jgi:hypothetical protein
LNPGTGLTESIHVEANTSEVGIGLNNTSTGGHYWIIESTGYGATEGAGMLGFYDNYTPSGGSPLGWRMVIDGSGNVGIGTTTPTAPLEVDSSTAANTIQGGNYGGTAVAGFTGTGVGVTGSSEYGGCGVQGYSLGGIGGSFVGTPAIFADGRVGIGTSSPLYWLDLRTPGSFSQMHIASTDTDAGGYLTSANDGNLFMAGGAAWNGSAWVAKNTSAYLYGGGPAGVRFFFDSGLTVGSTYTPTVRMIITPSGNVGIATTSPDQALSVNGNADKSVGGTVWGTFCDKRWKNPATIRPFTLGLDWVRTLPTPVKFHYAEDNGINADPKPENVNFIAQDLQDGVHDNLVYETRNKVKKSDKEPTTMYGVNVNDMHFAMVNAIKELAKENSTLREENRELRDEIKALNLRMEAFEQTIKIVAS